MTPRVVDLVCPICFDLGFTKTSFKAELADDEEDNKQIAEAVSNPPVSQESSNTANNVAASLEKLDIAERSAPAQQAKVQPDPQPSSSNPMVFNGPMIHKDDEHIEVIHTMPIDFATVEQEVRDFILDGRRPETDEGLMRIFPKAQYIKNRNIPFDYWIKQPCPAHRGDENPPCVMIRRQVHEFLMEREPNYAARQKMLLDIGYVEEGSTFLSFRIGHPGVGIKSESGEMVETSAASWSVEALVTGDIPSPLRKPFFRDDGFVICKRPLTSGDTASETAFQVAVKWFEDCATSHEGCSISEMPFLPDRVIEIGNSDDLNTVKLVWTQGKKGRYACLSHRWSAETPSTIQSKVEEQYGGIAWDTISTTYQEAIEFLRKFSAWHKEHHGEAIPYIWIDSLCIIQDSEDDWKKHSQEMCNIYSNSHITLVESFSYDKAKTLFSKASPNRVPSTSTIKNFNDEDINLHLRAPIFHPEFMVDLGDVPIWKRAWVLQERLLSPRLLIFGSEELSWQCSHGNLCECGLDQHSTEAQHRMKEWKDEDNINIRLPLAKSRKSLDMILGQQPTKTQLRNAWRLVLEVYSALDMTYRKDTLPAVAGLAQSFNRQLGQIKYFAGLWYEDRDDVTRDPQPETILDLLWRLSYLEDARRRDLAKPAISVSFSCFHPETSIVYPFVHDQDFEQYAFLMFFQGAMNVPKLPEDHAEISKKPWLNDMYIDAPPSSIILGGWLWPTRLSRVKTSFRVQDTEDREYCYHLGPMSDRIWQERVLGRPVDATLMLVKPPEEPGDADAQATYNKMPPIAFYPDNLLTEMNGPMYCMPMGRFVHLPVKKEVKQKTMMVALVLEAVGHLANSEGYDPDLSKRKPDELVFRRLGLAYTLYGGWEPQHEAIMRPGAPSVVRIV